MQITKLFTLNILLHRNKWEILRLIWIGFYKNDNVSNSKCKLHLLPKDIINHIIKMIGTPWPSNNQKKTCFELEL